MIKSLFSTCLNDKILFNSYEALVGGDILIPFNIFEKQNM
jgi:hypothetical protein